MGERAIGLQIMLLILQLKIYKKNMLLKNLPNLSKKVSNNALSNSGGISYAPFIGKSLRMTYETASSKIPVNKFWHKHDCLRIDGLPVPAKHLRLCGRAITDERHYVETARQEARRLIEKCACSSQSTVFDVGCGYGRLAIGLYSELKKVQYTGIDVVPAAVNWCKRHIRYQANFKFYHLDIRNERYNPKGVKLEEGFRFFLSDRSQDIIYLFSVFTHMVEKEMVIYLRDFHRLLRPNGRLVLKAFVEENCPSVEINPNRYIFEKNDGVLHVVRYEKSYLNTLLTKCGFRLIDFSHRSELDQQSTLILSLNP
jgi:SAM-dependent methyltransferase